MMGGPSLGHVHLKVSDLERSENFYRDVLGFVPTMRYGDNICFLAFDAAYHHHLALNVAQTRGAAQAPAEAAGILHFAILYPTHNGLIEAARRVIANGVEIFAASDHGNSVGLYLHDPDGIEVELTWDRDPAEWPRAEDGSPLPSVKPLDLPALLA